MYGLNLRQIRFLLCISTRATRHLTSSECRASCYCLTTVGAIYARNKATIQVDGTTTFVNNSASDNGGEKAELPRKPIMEECPLDPNGLFLSTDVHK